MVALRLPEPHVGIDSLVLLHLLSQIDISLAIGIVPLLLLLLSPSLIRSQPFGIEINIIDREHGTDRRHLLQTRILFPVKRSRRLSQEILDLEASKSIRERFGSKGKVDIPLPVSVMSPLPSIAPSM
jgi:hypothetical protein